MAEHVGPNSVDLCLSPKLLIYGNARDAALFQNPQVSSLEGEDEYVWCPQFVSRRVLDMKKDNPTAELVIPEEGLVLLPGQLYLGSTVEYTETHGFVPTIETRSSVARLGVVSHLSAGFGDCGFKGHWTLEIVVSQPVRVYPGVRICQISYSPVTGLETAYEGKYRSQNGPVKSMMFRDFAPDA